MIDRFFLPCPLDHRERGVQVYTPHNYRATSEPFPTLYMHDGLNVFRDEQAIGGVSLGLERYLDDHGLNLIVVAIDSNLDERVNQYCPWPYGRFAKQLIGEVPPAGGKGADYVDFVVNQVKPLIDKNYRTLEGETYMTGISLGGLITAFTVASYPHVFSRAAVMSSAFYANQEQIEEFLAAADLSSVQKFYLDCGTKEARENDAVSEQFLSSNSAVAEILREKIPDVQFEVIRDAVHAYPEFRQRVPAVLEFLLSE